MAKPHNGLTDVHLLQDCYTTLVRFGLGAFSIATSWDR
jgi:hypothetical protein